MLARLADKFVLKPSTFGIPVEGKTRRLIDFKGGRFEFWIQRTSNNRDTKPDLFVLKFPGTAGRAERATEHPAECWQDALAEVWTINPPGYGGSGGRASIRHMTSVADRAFLELASVANQRPILVTGNSLGSVSALYVAANHAVDGLLLRNPPPLKELILGRRRWWNLWLAGLIARQIPDELCSIRNVAQVTAPAVFVVSAKDRLVPPHFQQRVIDSYLGPCRVILLSDADHASPIEEHQREAYLELLEWLFEGVRARHQQRFAARTSR